MTLRNIWICIFVVFTSTATASGPYEDQIKSVRVSYGNGTSIERFCGESEDGDDCGVKIFFDGKYYEYTDEDLGISVDNQRQPFLFSVNSPRDRFAFGVYFFCSEDEDTKDTGAGICWSQFTVVSGKISRKSKITISGCKTEKWIKTINFDDKQ